MMIPLPYVAGGAAIVGAAIWARGKTGPMVIDEREVNAAIVDLCARLTALPDDVTPKQLALLVGDAIAPAMSWPPRPLSTAEHKAAWVLMQQWASETVKKAAQKGVPVCEFVTPKSTTLTTTLKAIPAKPKPSKPPGMVGGISTGPSNIADTPTPGRWSRPLKNPGAGLLQNVGHAYGVPSGYARLYASKKVNTHPFNLAHGDYRVTDGNFETNNYGLKILSFDGDDDPIYFPPASEALP